MAMSNRDRVGRGLEILAGGLSPFVEARMAAVVPDGRDWVEVLEARDASRHGSDRQYSRSDPRFLLRILTEEWRAFKDHLSRPEQSFASELRDTGNRWAHGEAFSADDTYRALDTIERLLTAVDAAEDAAQVHRLRLDLQRTAVEAETRKAFKSAAGVDGLGLKPWREVITPHRDVASGNFSASEFAADLYFVSLGEGSREYTDPVEFFRRTYLTQGLKDLLSRAARRVGGDLNASPVVNLQTNFGGGKTHSMLALWHLLSGHELADYPQELQELLAGHKVGALGRSARRVALVGNHIAAGKGSVKADGTHVKTLWGELAWQLGAARGVEADAREAYAIVADADATRSNPGAALHTLITAYAPCLLLIDEWVAYARQLFGRDDLDGGTFDTQFTFAQTLTEVVKSVPGAMLVVSIPASSEAPSAEERERTGSDLEVGGLNGREALARLQQVIRRMADQWRPASHRESFEIVRRRLFEERDTAAQADIGVVARTFTEFYARHRGEFPGGVGELAYEERIKAAYPIHPELFDRLYEDWSTLERFQRTRGVLRLMSAVIYALWHASDAAPLIMPGGVPLDAERVRSELTQYLEDDFKPIIDADIDGDSSTPAGIDRERSTLGQRSVTRRVARAIFFGSAPTLRSAHKGIEQPSIWLGVAVPGDTVGNFGSALHLLSDRATYLYGDGARYWYDTQASITRAARDYADRLRDRPEDVWAEIVARLTGSELRARGAFARVHIGSADTGDIPDDPAARLVIVHPQYHHVRGDEASGAMLFARRALDTRGSSQRVNRNMVVFLALDAKRMEDLAEAVRDYLAWKNIAGTDERVEELNLTAQQATQARTRLDGANQAVGLRIADAYHWALVPVQPQPDRPVTWDVVRADGARERLAERTSDKLCQADLLRTVHGARSIRYDLDNRLPSVWQHGQIRVGELWGYYCHHPYLPRLRDRDVLDDGILGVASELTWDAEGFAVATGYDEKTGRFVGLAIPHQDPFGQLTDQTLLVRPDLALAQRDRELSERAAAPGGGGGAGTKVGEGSFGAQSGGTGTSIGTGAGSGGPVQPPAGPKNTRFFGVARVNPERYARDLTRLSQEIIQHLAAPEGVELEVRVEISARKPDGFPEDKVRIVIENARTMKFESYGFEDR
jgi:predicted AAA+ superfamily ATPase